MSLQVQLVSPERILYEGEADMVIARTLGGGDIAFLTGHEPFLGALRNWPVKLVLTGGGEQYIAVHGGFVQLDHDRAIILSDVAELPVDIDVPRAQAAKERAEAALRDNPDSEEAQTALERATVRLEVATAA
ncbi:MAG TPA: ATP synthase F1 subunit epsilon [Acidimicrobiia bacterium]|nr:ATP synthase F1 subunit epsilon [Acidimicrobiia bacterium]